MGLFFKKTENYDASKRGKTVALLNQKGGVGKTTMSFNIAHALAEKGKKVLCIDMDPQANLSLLFGVDSDLEKYPFNIHHLLINSVRELKPLHVPTIFSDVLVRGKVDLLPAGQELSGFELTVAGITFPRQLVLNKFIDKMGLKDLYDYIVIDGPPTLGLLVVNILCATDGVLIPFKPDEFSRKGLNHFYDVLGDIEEMGVTQIPEVLAHIPNLVDGRRKQDGSDLLDITNELSTDHAQAKMVSPFFNKALLVKSHAQKKSVFDFNSKEFSGIQGQFGEIATIIERWGTSGN